MLLDVSTFPLVWMRGDASPEGDDIFKTFEALLQRGQDFVLLAASEGMPDEHEHGHEEKKQRSLWMKRHRSQLKLVKAMIAIEPRPARRLALKAFAGTFAKFWGYPMLLANSSDEAVQMARELLGEASVETFAAAG